MGFMKLFTGKDPEDYEKQGDRYFDAGEFGAAKIEYENALHKLEKKRPDDGDAARVLQGKIIRSRESLAAAHKKNAAELIENGNDEDAEDILLLALELTENRELRDEIEAMLQELRTRHGRKMIGDDPVAEGEEDFLEEPEYHEEGDDYFNALLSPLPEEIRRAYLDYGDTFREGYETLNRGDYEAAIALLSQAMDAQPPGIQHISYELGTAYLLAGNPEKARSLLKEYIRDFPDMFRGYHLLCEIFWELKDFDNAHAVIQSAPQELGGTLHMQLLRGEALFRAGNFEEAESFYQDCMERFGWDESLARARALTCEALGNTKRANELYGEIMNECQQNRIRIDPFIKARYADTAFDLGDLSHRTLELYLSLAEEVPEGRAHCFRRISRIYEAQGHEEETLRYQALAERLEGKKEQ